MTLSTDDLDRVHLRRECIQGGQETGTFFTHIVPRFLFDEADLSPFLTGVTITDPGRPRTFNELARRRTDLTSVVCP
jgi:hypothetical protein